MSVGGRMGTATSGTAMPRAAADGVQASIRVSPQTDSDWPETVRARGLAV